jgi:hypothetical protein
MQMQIRIVHSSETIRLDSPNNQKKTRNFQKKESSDAHAMHGFGAIVFAVSHS